MKAGILGGSFNPIHNGHLILADEARQKLKLDKVYFIPLNQPAHKEDKELLPARDRLRMVKSAVNGNPYFAALDIEIKRQGKSYTIDTLRLLRKEFPRVNKFFFIIGSDSLSYLESWKDINEVMKLAKFVAASRPNYPLKNCPKDILPLVVESVDISGFRLRQRIKNNESVRYYLPEEVYKYIEKKGLYR